MFNRQQAVLVSTIYNPNPDTNEPNTALRIDTYTMTTVVDVTALQNQAKEILANAQKQADDIQATITEVTTAVPTIANLKQPTPPQKISS